jgi:hypothetical protein
MAQFIGKAIAKLITPMTQRNLMAASTRDFGNNGGMEALADLNSSLRLFVLVN